QVERRIQGLQLHLAPRTGAGAYSGAPGSGFGSGLVPMTVEPHNHVLALAAAPGYVQFYDLFGDRHVTELDVAGRNWVSRTDNETLPEFRVEQLVMSAGGDWLVTGERRVDPRAAAHAHGAAAAAAAAGSGSG